MNPQRAKLHAGEKPEVLDFYARPGSMTRGGQHERALDQLPDDVGQLASIIQGLAVHQYMADAYAFTIPEKRIAESHIRTAGKILDRIRELDGHPLSTPRPVEKRVVGVCHHFALLMTTILRAKGIPARYRCGFGAYFNAPNFEDHVVCEYWNAAETRWVLVDSQLDDVWKGALKFKFDPLYVPRDQFITASGAWTSCRTGISDPARFGIFVGDLRGLWFIAASLIRDVAALSKMEMLPWDVWGAMPRPSQQLDAEQLTFFDQLATLTATPDVSFARLRAVHDEDERVQVPSTVFNALLNRPEPISA